jgi:organic hydroperoxide reductase OsmC/OhrA
MSHFPLTPPSMLRSKKGDAYFLQARLNVSLPGIEREVAQTLTDMAHETCPYSKATPGNIERIYISIVQIPLLWM